jgi:hypothetical protein
MPNLEFIKDLAPARGDNQKIALYKLENQYIAISTIYNLEEALDPPQRAIMDMSEILIGTASHGEETMVFPSNEKGEIISLLEIESANGDNSRQRVIDRLSTKVLDTYDLDEEDYEDFFSY